MQAKGGPSRPKRDKTHSVLRRLGPACAFLAALCMLVTVIYGNGYGALPPAEQRYVKAKTEMEKLKARNESDVGAWRRIAAEFHEIYKLDPKWNSRVAALYRKAESLGELARRTRVPGDVENAAAAYEKLALRHAENRLADDALLRAAELRLRTNEQAEALRLLERIRTQYAHGDMTRKALELERTIRAQQTKQSPPATPEPASGKKPGELNRIAWKTLPAGLVQITLEPDRAAVWRVRLRRPTKEIPARLLVELEDTIPLAQLLPGARVGGSPLTAVRVERLAKNRTRLFFDFTALAGYESRVEHNPFRIILEAATQGSPAATAPKAPAPLAGQAEKASTTRRSSSVLSATAPHDLASQLGLNVQRVFLDAGHGGKDPGASHNGISERDITLDIARRVGRLLQNNGLEVRYSREKDRSLSLTERTRMANAAKADIFVSIHVNASQDSAVSGFECYYLDLASNTEAARLATVENAGSDKKLGDLNAVLTDFMLSARTQESRKLAHTLRQFALKRLSGEGAKDGGVKSAPFHVLIGTGMPAVLVELGYCSNKAEARKLANPSYRKALAEGIAEGITAYRDKLRRSRSVDLNSP